MARASAAGEQDALRGYGYQYDHIATSVYDLYLAGRRFELRLVDPEAGAVDDCVLVLQPRVAGAREEVHGYQYKSGSGSLTLAGLLAEESDRRARPKPSLLAQLVSGWRSLKSVHGERDVVIHLVAPGDLSVHDRPLSAAASALGTQVDRSRVPSPQHTTAFFAWVKQSLAAGLALEDAAQGWETVLQWIYGRAGLSRGEVGAFFSALRLDASTREALPPMQAAGGQRADDIRQLAEVLRRRVQESNPGEPVVLVPRDVAALAGFGTRGRLRHSHRFPVDLDRYTPLLSAQQAMVEAIDAVRQGYLAVLGPPGSGKSTLLSQVTPGLADHVITYLTFMPGDPAAIGRASAADFLHDLVVELEGSELGSRNSLPEKDVNELRLRFRDLLARAAREFAQTGRRTLLVIDGLDHVARLTPVQTLLAELPAPGAVPDGVVVVLGSQTVAPLDERIRHHLSEPAGGSTRVVDLADHRLTSAAVEGACERLAEAAPGLRLSARQVARVIDLVAGHPLALGYVCNSLTDLLGDQQMAAPDDVTQAPVVSAEAIDAALDRCVRYSGNVADDYAAYLADADESDALRELLGDLARLRSPLNMRWVLTWANPAAAGGLRRVQHLFRRLDRSSWMFFHDSFRRFVLEATSVDALGEPDAAADPRRHSFLADECAKAPANCRERGEEFFHAARAGLSDRAIALATPEGFRARFLSGASPDVLTEDIRLAMQLTAFAGDAAALTGLMLLQAELRARQEALESVDVAGLYLDVKEAAAAIAYALPDGMLRIPAQQALRAAIRLDELGSPAGKLLFDGADVYDLGKMAGSDQWETLSAWTEAVVRFRPPSVLHTAVRRLFDQTVAHLAASREAHGGIDAWGVGRFAVYAAGHAASELWRAGRDSDAQAVARQLEEHTAVLIAKAQDGGANDAWSQRLARYARSAVAASRIAQASALLDDGQWDDALAVLQGRSREAPDGPGGSQPPVGAAVYGHTGDAAVIALRIAIAAARQGSGPVGSNGSAPLQAGDGYWPCSTETGEAALAYARELTEGLGPPASIVSGDLSSVSERSDVIAEALQERSCHMLIAGLAGQSAGRPVAEDLLRGALPALARPPADQPAGAGINPAAAAHRDRPAIEYAARLDAAVTGLAVLNAAISLDVLPLASLRALIVRAMSALPSLPSELVDSSRVRPHYASYLEMLIDVAARHSGELAGFAGERIGSATDPNRQNRRGRAAVNQSYLLRLRQQLGLRLLEHNVRVPWLDQAIADADGEIVASPGAYEHLDALATQIKAHAQGSDIPSARQLLSRVIPESFTPYWRKDDQLEEWVRWLLAADGMRPGALLAQARDIAPLLAVLTDATDGSAKEAGALLLEGVARIAPQSAIRLAAWQLGQGALSFADAHESLLSGFAAALIDAMNDEPVTLARIDDAAALLAAVMAGILAPVCRFAPSRALERTAELLGRLAPQQAAVIREQLARAVDVHVLPGIRSDWRRTLNLPSTPTTSRDAAEEPVGNTSEPEADDDDPRWGKSEFGVFKAADGTMTDPDIVLRSVTDLNGAFAWRSAQGEAGTFSWLPVLQPLIARAGKDQLSQITEEFRGIYDTAAVFVAVARRMREVGDLATASEVARRAIRAADPAAWSTTHGDAVRRQAWYLLTAIGDESIRTEALRDLAGLLTSADYWPGLLMLELRKILPLVAPGLPATRIWEQIQGYLHEMRAGLTEPRPPVLDGPVHAGWWAPMAEAQPPPETVPAQRQTPDRQSAQHRRDPASVGEALTDLMIIHLDHPMWAVPEGAATVLAWLLTHGGSLAAQADARVAAVLASTDDHPVLADALSSPADEPSTPSGVSRPPLPVTAARNPPDGEGLGGDGVREMAARAVAAAATGAEQAEPTTSLAAAVASRSWIAAQCVRQVRPGLASPPWFRPLPTAYQLSIPAPPTSGLYPHNQGTEMGPYGARAKVLAQATGLSLNAVLHRLWRLTELAQRRIPDPEARDRAARATRLDGLLSAPAGQALRAAFGAVAAELIAAGRVDAGDAELASLLQLVDIGLVRQPFNPIPGWIPVPVTRDWIPGDRWLSGTTGRLAEYRTFLATAGSDAEPASAVYVTLTCDMLSGSSLEFGPVAAVIGADHQFAVTDQGHPTERYLLASTFGRATPARADLPPSGIVIAAASQPTIRMTRAVDWLLSDGAPRDSSRSSSRDALHALPLIVNTEPVALQTNAAFWTCLDPRIAAYYGWRPHPTQPLCWQDAVGNLTAGTLIWRRASEDISTGHHDTVGGGSAVLVTSAGLSALTSFTGILRTHRVIRTVRRETDDETSAPPQQIVTAELPGAGVAPVRRGR